MKVFAFMVIEIGLALLAVAVFAVGPLLLWPRWMESPVAQQSLQGGALTAGLFLLCFIIYAGRTLKWPLMRWVPLANFSGPAIVILALAMAVFYFWPVSLLPPPDPASERMLSIGPRDEVQMTIWTLFTLFGYVPLTLASLFWHAMTMFVVWTRNKRVLQPAATPANVRAVLADGMGNRE